MGVYINILSQTVKDGPIWGDTTSQMPISLSFLPSLVESSYILLLLLNVWSPGHNYLPNHYLWVFQHQQVIFFPWGIISKKVTLCDPPLITLTLLSSQPLPLYIPVSISLSI